MKQVFDFDQEWINSSGVKKRLFELTEIEFGIADPNPIGSRFTLMESPAKEIRRDQIGYGNIAVFSTYKSGVAWCAKTYKSMLSQARKEGLIK